jgi:hypothetical protein
MTKFLTVSGLRCYFRVSKRIIPPEITPREPRSSRRLYLFIGDFVIRDDGVVNVSNIYWSRCPKGSTRLEPLEQSIIGISARFDWVVDSIRSRGPKLSRVLTDFAHICGLNPYSDDIARAAGYTLAYHPTPSES